MTRLRLVALAALLLVSGPVFAQGDADTPPKDPGLEDDMDLDDDVDDDVDLEEELRKLDEELDDPLDEMPDDLPPDDIPDELPDAVPPPRIDEKRKEPRLNRVEKAAGQRINVDLDGVDLADVCDQIGRQVGKNILVARDVEEVVRVSLRDIRWREALDVMARMTRCEVEEREGYLLLTQPAKVTMKATDAEVNHVLGLIATYSGQNLVFPGTLEGTVSVDFKEVHWLRALDAVADAAGLSVTSRDGYAIVTPRPLPKQEPRAARKRDPKPMRLNVDVEDASLAASLRQIGLQVGRNIVCDARVDDPLTISLNDLGWETVVDIIAERAGCDLREVPGQVLYVHRRPKVTLQFTQADLRTVLRLVTAYSGRNVVFGGDVDGSISVHVRNLAWDDALRAIAAAAGLHLQFEADHVRVASRPLPEAKEPPEAKRPEKPSDPIDVEFEKKTDLADAMEFIGRKVGINILVDPNVNESVTVSLRSIHWFDAMHVIARMTRCEVEARPGGIYLLTQPPQVSIQASDAPAALMFRMLGSCAGKNVVTGNEVVGTITTDLKEIHYLRAMGLLADVHGYSIAEQTEDLLIIKARERKPVPRRTLDPDSARERKIDEEIERIRWLALEGKRAEMDEAVQRLRTLVRRQARPKAAKGKPKGLGADDLRMLENRIEGLFYEIEALARDRQAEELIGKFSDLTAIMKEYGSDAVAMVKSKLRKWKHRLRPFNEVYASVKLQVFIGEGNALLREQAQHIRKERYPQAIEVFESIKALKDRMYAEELEIFHRNAEALYLRSKALTDRAKRLKRIGEFPLAVSAIVVVPRDSDEKDRAIINGRIYTEGDAILDAADQEIEGLHVVEIKRSTVRLRYEDTEFVRELQPGD